MQPPSYCRSSSTKTHWVLFLSDVSFARTLIVPGCQGARFSRRVVGILPCSLVCPLRRYGRFSPLQDYIPCKNATYESIGVGHSSDVYLLFNEAIVGALASVLTCAAICVSVGRCLRSYNCPVSALRLFGRKKASFSELPKSFGVGRHNPDGCALHIFTAPAVYFCEPARPMPACGGACVLATVVHRSPAVRYCMQCVVLAIFLLYFSD